MNHYKKERDFTQFVTMTSRLKDNSSRAIEPVDKSEVNFMHRKGDCWFFHVWKRNTLYWLVIKRWNNNWRTRRLYNLLENAQNALFWFPRTLLTQRHIWLKNIKDQKKEWYIFCLSTWIEFQEWSHSLEKHFTQNIKREGNYTKP